MPDDAPLLALLETLRASGYQFVTPTPETHRRVVGRASKSLAEDLRDIFGWSLPFDREILPAALFESLAAPGVLAAEAGLWRSRVRVSSMGCRLFLHSAFPTLGSEAVFFGPDSYRFVDFLVREIESGAPVRHVVDLGAGTGVGALMIAPLVRNARITLIDTNPLALRFSRINAEAAGVEAEIAEGGSIGAASGPIDLVIANPPFMMDQSRRAYRDGGTMLGAALTLEWATAAAARIEAGGRILLYSGSAIVGGEDHLRRALAEALPGLGCTLRYREIDPDIFGEQLDCPGYDQVERIAAIGAVIDKKPG